MCETTPNAEEPKRPQSNPPTMTTCPFAGMMPPKRKGHGCLIVTILFCTLLLCLVTASSCLALVGLSETESDEMELEKTFVLGNREAADIIAVIDVKGIITNSFDAGNANADNIRRIIRSIKSDENVKALIVSMDTPGGEVTAADEIYRELKIFGRPVIVHMKSMAASGGYYIACAADRIIASPTTMTGSIGVIIENYNYSELLDFVGIAPQIYTSREMKSMLNGSEPLNTEKSRKASAIVQELVNSAYLGFAKIVSESRKIPMDRITDGIIGDGRVFDAKQALELKLVDKLGYFDDALKDTLEIAKINPDSVKVIRYSESFSFMQLLKMETAGFCKNRISVQLPGTTSGRTALPKGRLYLLPFDL